MNTLEIFFLLLIVTQFVVICHLFRRNENLRLEARFYQEQACSLRKYFSAGLSGICLIALFYLDREKIKKIFHG